MLRRRFPCRRIPAGDRPLSHHLARLRHRKLESRRVQRNRNPASASRGKTHRQRKSQKQRERRYQSRSDHQFDASSRRERSYNARNANRERVSGCRRDAIHRESHDHGFQRGVHVDHAIHADQKFAERGPRAIQNVAVQSRQTLQRPSDLGAVGSHRAHRPERYQKRVFHARQCARNQHVRTGNKPGPLKHVVAEPRSAMRRKLYEYEHAQNVLQRHETDGRRIRHHIGVRIPRHAGHARRLRQCQLEFLAAGLPHVGTGSTVQARRQGDLERQYLRIVGQQRKRAAGQRRGRHERTVAHSDRCYKRLPQRDATTDTIQGRNTRQSLLFSKSGTQQGNEIRQS